MHYISIPFAINIRYINTTYHDFCMLRMYSSAPAFLEKYHEEGGQVDLTGMILFGLVSLYMDDATPNGSLMMYHKHAMTIKLNELTLTGRILLVVCEIMNRDPSMFLYASIASSFRGFGFDNRG